MAGVSKEQIEQARKIDLLSYLQSYEPDAIKKTSANEYCLIEHDSLKISNGKWHWFSRGIGGKDALTFLVKVRRMDFVHAVNILCGGQAVYVSPFQQIQPIAQPLVKKIKLKEGFALPKPHKDNFRAIAYLQSRGINRDVIDYCINAEILYESENYHNVIFVGRDKENKPRYACARSTINNFRQDIEGSDKRYSFCIPSNDPDSRFIMLAEAPIDVLSLAAIRKMDSSAAEKYHYLSLGGTSVLAPVQYLTDNPKIEYVIVCFDNDRAGQKCVDRVKEAVSMDENLKNRRIAVITEPPPTGKDFNDTLLAMINKQKESKHSRQKKAVIE